MKSLLGLKRTTTSTSSLLNKQSLLRFFSQAQVQHHQPNITQSDLASAHKMQHLGVNMDPRFYEDMIIPATDVDQEIDFMRAPFYEFAQAEQMS